MKTPTKIRTVTLRKFVALGIDKIAVGENRTFSNMVDTILGEELERRDKIEKTQNYEKNQII